MEVKVRRVTPPDLWRECAGYTTGKDCKMSWSKMLALGHSPIRASIYFVEMRNIPLFCASQFVRSNVGVQFFQLSKRTDRGGEDFRKVCKDIEYELRNHPNVLVMNDIANEIKGLPDKFDRYTPVDLACVINAEAIITMSRKRLCAKASAETREIWGKVVEDVSECDPDLAKHCVKPCVYCGFCREAKPCGYMKTDAYKKQREDFLKLFE